MVLGAKEMDQKSLVLEGTRLSIQENKYPPPPVALASCSLFSLTSAIAPSDTNLLAACSDHLAGVLLAGLGDHSAAQHACDFLNAGAVVKQAHLDFGAAVVFALLDEKMLVGEGGDLRKMCNAEHLLDAAQGFEFLAYCFGSAAADADVDFVEDQRARGDGLFARTAASLLHADLEGQHDAAHFAAGSDFVERLERLA